MITVLRTPESKAAYGELVRDAFWTRHVRAVAGGSNNPNRIVFVCALRWWLEVLT